jgi:hypothetical protein
VKAPAEPIIISEKQYHRRGLPPRHCRFCS